MNETGINLAPWVILAVLVSVILFIVMFRIVEKIREWFNKKKR